MAEYVGTVDSAEQGTFADFLSKCVKIVRKCDKFTNFHENHSFLCIVYMRRKTTSEFVQYVQKAVKLQVF